MGEERGGKAGEKERETKGENTENPPEEKENSKENNILELEI